MFNFSAASLCCVVSNINGGHCRGKRQVQSLMELEKVKVEDLQCVTKIMK